MRLDRACGTGFWARRAELIGRRAARADADARTSRRRIATSTNAVSSLAVAGGHVDWTVQATSGAVYKAPPL